MDRDTCFFYATTEDRGDLVFFDDGGQHEKILDDGVPRKDYSDSSFVGWHPSQIPQIAASHDRAGALYKELSSHKRPSGGSEQLVLYRIYRQPDHDISDCTTCDFHISQEVRYDNPEDDPIPARHDRALPVPERAVRDVLDCSTGEGNIDDNWAQAVKRGLEQLIRTKTYPEQIEREQGIERPSPEATER